MSCILEEFNSERIPIGKYWFVRTVVFLPVVIEYETPGIRYTHFVLS